MGSGQQQVEAFLVAAPVPSAERAKPLTRLLEQARLDQRPPSPRALALLGWTTYLTNIPDLSFANAHILARTRWQIELLFKLWKSHGGLLRSRASNPFRQQVEGFAKLLGLILAHGALLVSGWDPDALSSLDALRVLRQHLSHLYYALNYWAPFADFFHFLSRALHNAAPRQKRRTKPAAFQLWRSFDAAFP